MRELILLRTLSGDGADIFICDPDSTGSNTTCTYTAPLFWNGSAHGIGQLSDDPPGTPLILDGFFVVDEAILYPVDLLDGGFEEQFTYWTVYNDPQGDSDWRITTDAYTGQYAAEGHLTRVIHGTQSEIHSASFTVEANRCYQIAFYLRKYDLAQSNGNFEVAFNWYDSQGNQIARSYVWARLAEVLPTTWQNFSSDVAIAPSTAFTARAVFNFDGYNTLTEEESMASGSYFLDGVEIWNQHYPCNP